jgi:hypothetical protein
LIAKVVLKSGSVPEAQPAKIGGTTATEELFTVR